MAEDKKAPANVEQVPYPAPQYSNDQLLKMVAESNAALAKALENVGKPYVDPAVAKAKKEAAEEMRKNIAMQLRIKQATKAQCLHMRTNNDGTWDEKERLNIKWMVHSNGITTGVCGTCGSPFDATIVNGKPVNAKDYAIFVKDQKGRQRMGRCREDVSSMRYGG
jgi:hypothetical protein